jgi:hypothetical protein
MRRNCPLCQGVLSEEVKVRELHGNKNRQWRMCRNDPCRARFLVEGNRLVRGYRLDRLVWKGDTPTSGRAVPGPARYKGG